MLGVIQQRAHSLSSRKVCPAPPTVMWIQSFTSNYTHQVASSSVRLPSSGRARRNVVVHNDTPGWAGGNSTEKAMFGDVSRLGGLCGATHSMELSTLSPSPACATHHHLNTGMRDDPIPSECPSLRYLHRRRAASSSALHTAVVPYSHACIANYCATSGERVLVLISSSCT